MSAAGTYAPRPGAAPFARMVRAQTGLEIRMVLRNGEQLLLTVVIPVLVLVVFGSLELTDIGGRSARLDFLVPGVLALAVLSTAFTGLAIGTGFERRYGALKRLGASPLPRAGLLAAKAMAVLAVEALQIVLLCVVALLLGWDAPGGLTPWLSALLLVVAGTAAFSSLGLLMAGTLRAEATLAAANLVYLLLLVGGAVVFPARSYGSAGAVLSWLPSGALGSGMRTALIDGAFPVGALLVLAGWALVGSLLTARTFTWE
jgi:ABC-2 type transport system permease protein